MLPDLRFAIGAVLALAVLSVAALGVVTSVRLAREARIAPLNDPRSLAYAGQAELNQFYDPESARRFAGANRGGSESALPAPPRETPVSSEPAPASAAAGAPEQTASLPVDRPASETMPARDGEPPAVAAIPDAAPIMLEKPPPEPAQPPETTVTVTIVPTDDAPPLPDASQTSGPPAPALDRVASLPVTTPEEDRPQQAPPAKPAQAAVKPASDPNVAPPMPRARPKLEFHRRVARARPRPAPATQPTTPTAPSSPFGAWPNLPSTGSSKAATR